MGCLKLTRIVSTRTCLLSSEAEALLVEDGGRISPPPGGARHPPFPILQAPQFEIGLFPDEWTGVLSHSERGIKNIPASQDAPILLNVVDTEGVRLCLPRHKDSHEGKAGGS